MVAESALPAAVRRERIVAIVEEQGFARVTDLSGHKALDPYRPVPGAPLQQESTR